MCTVDLQLALQVVTCYMYCACAQKHTLVSISYHTIVQDSKPTIMEETRDNTSSLACTIIILAISYVVQNDVVTCMLQFLLLRYVT